MPQVAKEPASSEASAKIYCPCCPKWEIKRPERCSNTLTFKSKTLYFCTARCKERFEKAPEKFAS